MRKRVIASVLAALSVFLLAGCGAANDTANNAAKSNEGNIVPVENTETNTVPQPEEDGTRTAINGIEFDLDKEASFNGLAYTVSSEFREADQVSYVQYNYYTEDSTNLFFFRIFFYKNSGVEAAAKDLGLEEGITLSDGKTGDIDYRLYARPRDDGGTMHFYFIEKDGNIFVVSFVCKYDIRDFEEKAIGSLRFL